MMILVVILALLGLGISAYMYWIEQTLKMSPNYQAACDLSDRVSCTRVIKSEYSHLLYISNNIVGIIFYSIVAILGILDAQGLVFIAALGACISSVYLAYLIYIKIKSYCVMCTSLYVINILLLLASL